MKAPDFGLVAIDAFVKNWAKEQNDSGRTTTEIARQLGYNSHATIVQWLTPGHPIKVTDRAQRRIAELLFGGSRDAFEAEALRWFTEQQESSPVDLPPEYLKAAGHLEVTYGSSFDAAAQEHFRSVSCHRPEGLTVAQLAEEILRFSRRGKKEEIGLRPVEEFERVGRPNEREG